MRRPQDGVVYSDQVVPEHGGPERPDLVVLDRGRKVATIVDVCCPFENGEGSFDEAREVKLRKYALVRASLTNLGYETSLETVIVGALGGWCPKNALALSALGIGRRYTNLLRRLAVSDNIRWARDITIEHITGHRQYP